MVVGNVRFEKVVIPGVELSKVFGTEFAGDSADVSFEEVGEEAVRGECCCWSMTELGGKGEGAGEGCVKGFGG